MPFEFVFLRPWWLVLIPVGILLTILVTRRHRNSWKRVCDIDLFSKLTLVGDRVSERFVWLSIMTGWMLAVLALAGPAWERDKAPLYQSVDAMVVVFDLSRSMASTDLLPSRLERARFKAIEVVEAQEDKSVGLVVFAGDAFDVTPISDDIGTVTHLLKSLQIGMMPAQGSLASKGLRRAEQLLDNSGFSSGTILLLTDGVDEDAFSAAKSLRQKGYRLSVIAVGTKTGSPIRLDNGDFLKDPYGDFVVSPVDLMELTDLTSVGGGFLTLVTEPFSESMLQSIHYSGDRSRAGGEDVSVVSWVDRGPLLLLLLLPLASLIFRRGWLVSVFLFLSLGTQPTHAFEWGDLWQRSDQRAANAVKQGDFANPKIMEHPGWNGIALYRQDRFYNAAAEFSKGDDKVSKFNHGNALARGGELQGAVEQYEAALAIDPEFEDAMFNLALVKKVMQEQQQQKQQSSAPEKQDSGDDESAQNSDEPERTPPAGERAEGEKQQMSDKPRERMEHQHLADAEQSLNDERLQLMEQWLRVIPDDPAGLLRRRFHYEYQQRDHSVRSTNSW